MANTAFITKRASQTQKLGRKLALQIMQNGPLAGNATVIGLVGDLGGGKTTFLQGFANGLGLNEKIVSPTFVLVKRFKLPVVLLREIPSPAVPTFKRRFNNLYHIDCYRIQKTEEILNLNFKEMLLNSENIIAVEWADKIKKILPRNAVRIKFDFVNKNTRRIGAEGWPFKQQDTECA